MEIAKILAEGLPSLSPAPETAIGRAAFPAKAHRHASWMSVKEIRAEYITVFGSTPETNLGQNLYWRIARHFSALHLEFPNRAIRLEIVRQFHLGISYRHSQFDSIILRVNKILFCAKVPLSRLYGCIAQQKLNLFGCGYFRTTAKWT